ncbi:hypothetical protein Csa_004926 [Cucumis sativus]|uniref:Uncharacterized protein n=1 Tax=Cucumis sativus TaxID=3659 RepID=A0A0A0KAT9_CUCSA|nr:hypothetical protein Csa_004926 [Cucumis sativus]
MGEIDEGDEEYRKWSALVLKTTPCFCKIVAKSAEQSSCALPSASCVPPLAFDVIRIFKCINIH